MFATRVFVDLPIQAIALVFLVMLLFLQNWYLQTLMFSTQDQVGLSFVAQMMSEVGLYSLPDRERVNGTGLVNSWYTKHNHGT